MAVGGAIRAGRAFVELFAEDSKLEKGLRQAQTKLRAWGAAVQTAGKATFALGASLTGPIVGAALQFASVGDALDKMSGRTGVSVESLSQLKFAAEQSGASFEQLETGVRTMQKNVTDFARGAGEAKTSFEALGLSVEDLQGLSPDEAMKRIADGLAGVEDPSARAAHAMKIFGQSGQKLVPMLSGGSAGISELMAEADALGLTMSGESAKSAAAFTDAMNRLWSTLKMVYVQIGAAVAPVLTDLANRGAKIVASIIAWVKENKKLIISALAVAASIAGAGIALIGLGGILKLAAGAVGLVAGALVKFGAFLALAKTLLLALLSPVGLVVAGVAAIGAAILYYTGAGSKALTWLKEKFGELLERVKETVGAIGDALAAGDIKLAGEILWLSLKAEFQRGITAIMNIWTEWKTWFLQLFNTTVAGVTSFFNDAWASMRSGWNETTTFMLQAWTTFVSKFRQVWNDVDNWLTKRWLELMSMIDPNFDLEAAKRMADEDNTNRNAAIEGEAKAENAARETALQDRLKEIEKKRSDAAAKITNDAIGADAGLTQQRDADIAATNKALAEAIKARQEAIDRARGAGEGAGEQSDYNAAYPGGRPDGMTQAVEAASRGTFNAAALLTLNQGTGRRDPVIAVQKKTAEELAIQTGLLQEIGRTLNGRLPRFN